MAESADHFIPGLMPREYECLECGRSSAVPLEVQECRVGCGQLFCAGCLPDHELLCQPRPGRGQRAKDLPQGAQRHGEIDAGG